MEEKFYCVVISTKENETDEEIAKRLAELYLTGAWAGQFVLEAFVPLEDAYVVETLGVDSDSEGGEDDDNLN